MSTSNRVIAAPAEEPISVEEALRHCRQPDESEGDYLEAVIVGVRQWAEGYLHRALVTQTREQMMDFFPACGVRLQFGPVQSVTSIKYIDTAGVEQTASNGDFDIDLYSEPARIVPGYGKTRPVTQPGLNKLAIRYVAGYGAATAVPRNLKHGLLLAIGHLYENREDVLVGVTAEQLPMNSLWLLNPYVIHGA